MNTDTAEPDEIDALVDDLTLPRAGVAYDQIRGEALARLLVIGGPAHARILERVDVDEPLPQFLAVLPLFGDPASIPVLRRALLDAPDPTTVTAAHALADHPDDAAFDALVDGLSSRREQTVHSAVLGLGHRGDVSAVAHLRRVTGSDEMRRLVDDTVADLTR